MTEYRELKFSNLADVEREVDLLSRGPMTTTGNWSFFQILSHLADTIEDSYKPMPAPEKPVESRTTEILFKRLQKSGKMKPGYVNPALPQERAEGDVSAARKRLETAIANFRTSTRLNHEPSLGYLSHEQFEFLHAIHCAMHLGFAKL